MPAAYIGRLAPSPTGLLHLGHAATFWTAYQRALAADGTLLLRNEDLDPHRSRAEFTSAMLEDLVWLGIRWTAPSSPNPSACPYTAKPSTGSSAPASSTPAAALARTSPA